MSWKQYGGINKHESMNNINLNSLSVDSLRLTGKYIGDFDVSGNLNASVLNIEESLVIEKDILIKRDLTVEGNVNATGTLSFTDLGLTGNLVVAKNITTGGNLKTNANLIVVKNIYMGQNQDSFFHLENENVGLNTYSPAAAFDISGNAVSSLNVFSNNLETKNILARNVRGNGVVLTANSSASGINFYTSSLINLSNIPDSYIIANSNGNLLIDTPTNTQISSNIIIGNRSNLTSQTGGESLVIFDNPSNIPLNSDIYKNQNATIGTGMGIYANTNTSVTSLNMITPNSKGTALISGAYPLDSSRSMLSVNYLDPETYNFVPSQVIVSGNNAGKNRTTTGFNTYAPKTDKYVVDINGPIHVTNGYIKDAKSVNMEIRALSQTAQFQQNIVALGSPSTIISQVPDGDANKYKQYCYYSNNGGQTWTRSNVNPGGNVSSDIETVGYKYQYFSSVYSYDISFSIAVTNSSTAYIFYTCDGGINWYQFSGTVISSLQYATSVYIDNSNIYISNQDKFFYFRSPYTNKPSTNSIPFPKTTEDTGGLYYNISTEDSYITTVITLTGETINKMIGTPTKIILATNNGIKIYNKSGLISTSSPSSSHGTDNYSLIHNYGDNNIVAIRLGTVGTGKISYTYDGGNTWNDVNNIDTTDFKDLYVYNEKYAIVVGTNLMIYSSDGYQTWSAVPDEILTSSGNKSLLIDEIATNTFTSIKMTDANTFVISAVKTAYDDNTSSGNSHLFYCYFPNLFNRVNNTVFDISGNMKITGNIDSDFSINSNGLIVSSQTPSLNTSTGSVIISGSVGIGGNINIGENGTISSTKNSTGITSGALIVSGGIGVAKDLNIGGNIISNSDNKIITTTYYEGYNGGNIIIGKYPGIGERNIQIGNIDNTDSNQSNRNIISLGGPRDLIQIRGSLDTSISNNTTVGGNTVINGYLNVICPVNSKITMETSGVSVQDSTSSSTGLLVVSGGVGVSANVNIAGNLTSGGNIVSSENAIILKNLFVNGNTESISHSNGTLVVPNGGVGIHGNLNVGGNSIIEKGLTVKGNIDSTSTVTGSGVIYGGLGVTGNVNIGRNIVGGSGTDSLTTTTGALRISGGIGTTGNIHIGGNGIISKNITINGTTASTSISSGALLVSEGGAGIGGNLYVGGLVKILGDGDQGIESTDSSTGSLLVVGGVGITENINADGNLVISGSSQSTSFGTGAIRVPNGGMGVTGNIYSGNNIVASGNIIASGNVVSSNIIINSVLNSTAITNGALTVAGGVGIAKSVNIGGNLTVGNTAQSLSISTGSAVFSGGVGIAKDQFLGGNLVVQSTEESVSTTTGSIITSGGIGVSGNAYVQNRLDANIGQVKLLEVQGSGKELSTNTISTIGFGYGGSNTPYNFKIDSIPKNRGGQGDIGTQSDLVFSRKTLKDESDSTYSECMRIVGPVDQTGSIGGYIGINNSSPAYTLDVGGNVNISNQLRLSANSGNISGANFQNNGFIYSSPTGLFLEYSNTKSYQNSSGFNTANVYVNDIFLTSGNAGNGNINGNLSITANLSVAGNLSVTTNATMSSNVSVSKLLTVSNTTDSNDITRGINFQGNAILVSTGGNILMANIANQKYYFNNTNFVAGNILANIVGNGSSSVIFPTGINITNLTQSTSSITGAFIVSGGAGIGGNGNIGGNLNVKEHSFFGGNSSITGLLNVSTSATSTNGKNRGIFYGANTYVYSYTDTTKDNLYLNVNGNVYTFAGNTFNIGPSTASISSTTGALIVGGGVGITGNINIAGNIYCGGNIDLADRTIRFRTNNPGHYISYNSSIDGVSLAGWEGGNLIYTNTSSGGPKSVLSWRNTGVNILTTTESSSKITGALVVTGGIGTSGNISGGGNIISQNFYVQNIFGKPSNYFGDNNTDTNIYIKSGTYSQNFFSCSGILSATSSIESTSTSTGSIVVDGGIGISGNINIGSNASINGNVRISNTLASTSKITGALVINGGIGIGGNIYCGENIYCPGNIDLIDKYLRIRGDNNHYIKYNSTINGIELAGFSGGMLKSVFSGNTVLTWGNISVNIPLITPSISTDTGALQIDGGIGINGNIYSGGIINATSFNATSDYRIKANVIDLDNTFSVSKLRPVHYFNKILEKPDIGFLAHEVQEEYPYLVSGEKDGEQNQSINYNGIIGILVKEIKDLREENKKINKIIDELKNLIEGVKP